MLNVTDSTESPAEINQLINILTLYGEQAIHTIDKENKKYILATYCSILVASSIQRLGRLLDIFYLEID